MGTGSHRPQFEAAKGRPDETGGIQHVRALRSHTKLKYRERFLTSKKPSVFEAIENESHADQLRPDDIWLPTSDRPDVELPSSDNQEKDSPLSNDTIDQKIRDEESSDDSDDELLTMQRELQRLKQREALRSQKESKAKGISETASSKWRSENVFKKTKKRPKKDSFVDKFVR